METLPEHLSNQKGIELCNEVKEWQERELLDLVNQIIVIIPQFLPKVPFFVNDFKFILFISKHIANVRCVWNIWNTITFGNGTVTRKIIFMQSNYDTFLICKILSDVFWDKDFPALHEQSCAN